ncbi:MAG: glycosyltransferase [Gemmatimonadaceae bacterium]
MRILVVTHNYPRVAGDPAGAFVRRLAVAARRAGAEICVVAPHATGAREEEQDEGVSVTRFRYAPDGFERVAYRGDLHRVSALSAPLVALGLPFFIASFARAITRAVAAFAPDVIHAHWWIPGGWLASRPGTPFIVTAHGSDVRLLDRSALLRRRALTVLARASAITTVSRFLADDIRRVLPTLATPVHVARMPVDVAHFEAGRSVAKADPPRILYAGNLLASKGVDVLLHAFAILRQQAAPCGLKLLGSGPELATLRRDAERLGVAGDVTWSPFVSQEAMPAEYGASTVTVLPTRGRAEGLGLTLVEALLSGSAVVGTHAGGIPEVVTDGVSGLLAPDGDAASLASQIARLLADSNLRAQLTERGRRMVREAFAPDAAAARFLSLYDDVVRHRRAA